MLTHRCPIPDDAGGTHHDAAYPLAPSATSMEDGNSPQCRGGSPDGEFVGHDEDGSVVRKSWSVQELNVELALNTPYCLNTPVQRGDY